MRTVSPIPQRNRASAGRPGERRPEHRATAMPSGRLPNRRTAQTTAIGAQSILKDPFRLGISLLLIETIAKVTSEIPVLRGMRIGLMLFAACSFYAVLN